MSSQSKSEQRTLLLLLVGLIWFTCSSAATPDALFQQGTRAYESGRFVEAANAFRESALVRPAGGTLQNLGNAEWQRGQAGPAILAWEQALWLDPFNQAARGDLRFARKVAQLEAPELTWSEVISSWLPLNWWAWIAGLSLWLAVGMGMLPGIFRARKAAWHQALAALGLAVFLLCVPAHMGVDTRCGIGFILAQDTPLRLTPTHEAQVLTRLPAGAPARLERARGNFLLIRTSRTLGWVEKHELGLLCQENKGLRTQALRSAYTRSSSI